MTNEGLSCHKRGWFDHYLHVSRILGEKWNRICCWQYADIAETSCCIHVYKHEERPLCTIYIISNNVMLPISQEHNSLLSYYLHCMFFSLYNKHSICLAGNKNHKNSGEKKICNGAVDLKAKLLYIQCSNYNLLTAASSSMQEWVEI